MKTIFLIIVLAVFVPLAHAAGNSPPNILLIAVDDMGHDTPTSFGGWVEGLTPNIDTLASRGMAFTNAYNTSSRCAPSRGSIMTGLYQDNYNVNRGSSDTTVRASVLTIPEYLRQKDYMTGLFGKDTHYRPLEKYGFDEVSPMAAMAVGRSPELYAENIGNFIDRALAKNRPFFISANTHDPHRPYAGAPGEQKSLERRFKQETRKLDQKPEFVLPPKVTAYSGKQRPAPGFIPDHELVREEFGYYLNSSYRADLFVGALMQVLKEKNLLDDTLVIFHSDNGMHWPYAKSNVYVASVKTPFVIYWQGRSVAGTSSDSLVSTIDILPTILEAAGLALPDGLPGKSLLPLLSQPGQAHHEQVFATLNAKGDIRYEMRSVIDENHIYIYNKWVDGQAKYHDGKYPGGMALKGMEAAAQDNEDARQRLEFFYNRTPEELYDLRQDPNALVNLAAEKSAADTLHAMRGLMLERLATNADPYLEDFKAFLERAEQSGTKQPVMSLDFESVPPGSTTEHLLQHQKLSLAHGEGMGASTGLKAKYVGYERGSERIVRRVPLSGPGLEFSLNYDVKLDDDFQFVTGGKLHGLGPVKHITGGRPIVPEGWSARVTFTKDEGLKLYTYHQDMQGQYGDRGDIQRPFKFEKERYYAVSLHVRVNDPANASNGFSRLYVDGQLIEQHENLRLRGTGGEATLINKFMFSSFHGGHRPQNAPRDKDGNYTTVHATFDNFSIYEGENIRQVPGQ